MAAEDAWHGHLPLELLRVYRSQDKGRVFLLDEVVDREKLRVLLERLDHEGTLRRRYQTLTEKLLKNQERRAKRERTMPFAEKLRVVDQPMADGETKVEDLEQQ